MCVVFLLLGCRRHDEGKTPLDFNAAKVRRDYLCATWNPEEVERCDRSTFDVLMAAMCDKLVPRKYENPIGKWNRDTAECYPTDSRSETSRDTYLSLVLSQDKEAIANAITWAESNNGDTGHPVGGVGNVKDLLPLMRRAISSDFTTQTESMIDDGIEAAKTALSGHRGHLIGEYIWAEARINGGITALGATILRQLNEETPNSPWLSCMYRRFSRLKLSQDVTIELLDMMKWEPNTFGWGSSIPAVHYAMTVKCLEGR